MIKTIYECDHCGEQTQNGNNLTSIKDIIGCDVCPVCLEFLRVKFMEIIKEHTW